jgi:general L-amino acid transport system permease protein
MSLGRPNDRPVSHVFNNPTVRGVFYQALLAAAIACLAYFVVRNTAANLARANIASGFGFWNVTAGFDISQTLIDYSFDSSTYGRAFFVGLLNTLLVAGIGIVLATVLGFTIGIARLSGNWLVARLAAGYVESVRNVPLLLQLLFWYNAVLKALPDIRASIALPGGTFINNRGLFLPRPLFGPGFGRVVAALALGLLAATAVTALARRRAWWGPRWNAAVSALMVAGPPVAVFALTGATVSFALPEVGRFNIRGGVEVLPELVALVFGLVIYTAAFIAEVVRAGIMAVPKGQSEAARALGLHRNQELRLVIVPQAMRVIIPPLTNQYLNLTKNSSLAVAIGYPDLVQIFAGTVLNVTGQAVEVVVITMGVYLVISLLTSLAMNLYNARVAVPER